MTTEPSAGESPPADAPGTPAATPDDLPQQLELTPEIIEDEALRNDLMLRFAVILLAVLAAFTKINDSTTLVHIRGGEHIATQGFSKTDSFTYTTEGREWVNLSWLFDLLVYGVYAAGGGVGLTLLNAAVAGLAFFFVIRTRKQNAATWWGSVCAALALLACLPHLHVQTELITILGLSVMLWLLMRWQGGGSRKNLWWAVGITAVWCNLDPRAFMGVALVVLFALGETIATLLSSSDDVDDKNQSWLGAAAGMCLAACLLHPFLWETLLSPMVMYGNEYPTIRGLDNIFYSGSLAYLPLFEAQFWQTYGLRLPSIAALLLAAIVPICFILNRQNFRLSHVLVYAGFVAFALFSRHELPAAAVVFAVLATINAQEWYAENFRQTYSVALSERFFSVGGRALTAITFFVIAAFICTGRLYREQGGRFGAGVDGDLQTAMDGVVEDLENIPSDQRGFNFGYEHGNLLIWAGRKPFIDGRVRHFSRSANRDVLDSHRETALAILPRRDIEDLERGRPEVVTETFNEYEISHVITPLRMPYRLHVDLLQQEGRYAFTGIGTVVGIFYRRDTNNEEWISAFLKASRNHLELAFRTDREEPLQLRFVPEPPPLYETLLSAAPPESPPHLRDAWNYSIHMSLYQQFNAQAACAHLTLQEAQTALETDPDNHEAYYLMGLAYSRLRLVEARAYQFYSQGRTMQPALDRRYVQALNAFSQAVVCNPDDTAARQLLAGLYNERRRYDLTLLHLRDLVEAAPEIDETNEQQRAQRDSLERTIEELDNLVDEVRSQVDKQIAEAKGTPNFVRIAAFAEQQGCILLALAYLDKFSASELTPDLMRKKAELLLEAGRTSEATTLLRQMEEFLGGSNAVRFMWRDIVAHGAVISGDYQHAVELYTAQSDQLERDAVEGVIALLPFVSRPTAPPLFGAVLDNWAPNQIQAAINDRRQAPEVAAAHYYWAGLAELESGRPSAAGKLFDKCLETKSDAAIRPLAWFYSTLISNQPSYSSPPSSRIPIWSDMFAGTPARAEKPKPPIKE